MADVKANPYGFPVMEDENCLITERKQNKTCTAKWVNWILAKVFGFKTVSKPDPNIHMAFGRIIGHPETIKAIREQIKQGGHP